MSPIAIRRHLGNARRRGALLLAVIALAGALTAHHAPMDMHGMGPTSICLAILIAAAPIVLVAAVGRILPRAPRRLGRPVDPYLHTRGLRPAPRAGPSYLRLLVIRR